MIVKNLNTGWSDGWLRGLTAWACEQLDIAADFPITFRPGMGKGRARQSVVTPGGQWQVTVCLSRRIKYWSLEDPRTKAIHEWIKEHEVYPLLSVDEYLLFVLGHELFHLIDPFSNLGKVRSKKSDVRFLEMERRCDEAGLELVRRARLTGEAWERARRVESSERPAGPAPTGLADLYKRVQQARKM